jgi:stalled ribosome rescue protein Dom34
MKSTKKLGIWMDHSFAHIMEFTSKHFEIETIESELKTKENSKRSVKIDSKQKKILSTYYTKIGDYIQNYKRVILFGPTDAKVELFDFLSEDERFLKIKFEIKNTDKMTQSQQHTFVKEYFSRA